MNIRPFCEKDTDSVVFLWTQCHLIRSWNNPKSDINRKLNYQPELFFVGELEGQIIATAMFGYEGHRGWVNYLAVSQFHQRKGHAKRLMEYGEQILQSLGCPKINLQIRNDNAQVISFYQSIGYLNDNVISYGKRLITD